MKFIRQASENLTVMSKLGKLILTAVDLPLGIKVESCTLKNYFKFVGLKYIVLLLVVFDFVCLKRDVVFA